MRNAPAVQYPVGRCRFHGWLVLSASLLGLVVITGWHMTANVAPLFTWGSAIFCIALVANAGYRWFATRAGELVWTGQVWRYASWVSRSEQRSSIINGVKVVLDLQSILLIRLSGPGSANHWLWSERRHFPARWLGLRRALFAAYRPERIAKPHSPFLDEIGLPSLPSKPLRFKS